MIARYTRKKMAQIWATENRYQKMLDVEVAVARVEAKHKIIPQKAAREIAAKGKFKTARIEEIEQTTKHDVIAFVQSVAESVGPDSGAYIHYGLTSSDVLDTALGLQLKDAAEEMYLRFDELEKTLIRVATKHASTLCAGRTHGMHAELTSFGVKLSGYLAELKRQRERFTTAMKQATVGKLSGAVGTYSSLPANIEIEVCKALGLTPETIATQVVPRDRMAEVFCSLGMLGGFIERLAIEFRHLQRSEVSEVIECFNPGQKGSSAMPHKKNPISAENLTGLARLLRSYVVPALENMALWHERDISHSSVERVILPDAFILADYALDRLNTLVAKAFIDKDRMRANIDLSQGQLFSSQILLLLVRKGLTRDEAYKIVQEVSHNLKSGEQLQDKIMRHPDVKKRLRKNELEAIFKESHYRDRFKNLVAKVIKA
jgi:adenylosuccinate lyase